MNKLFVSKSGYVWYDITFFALTSWRSSFKSWLIMKSFIFNIKALFINTIHNSWICQLLVKYKK